MSQMCSNSSHDNLDGAFGCASCSEPLRELLGAKTVLAGRYRVTHGLGQGGMGAVYQAEASMMPGLSLPAWPTATWGRSPPAN